MISLFLYDALLCDVCVSVLHEFKHYYCCRCCFVVAFLLFNGKFNVGLTHL
jgi:hypothetical protein